MTKNEFIKQIAAAAQKYAPQYGISIVSPCIAQACLESGYGTSNKAKYHNYFGLKYRKNRVTCNSGYFKDGSQEQKTDGTYYPVTDDWYAFATLETGVEGYFQFINISTYSNLKGVTDPKKYLQLIKQDGYATSINYVDNVYKVITSNNLTQYDKNNIKEEKTVGYTNSSLVSYTVKSPNHSGTRTHAIDRITPHCVVGQLKAQNIGSCFTSSAVSASCNYGIGTEGKVVLCVDEANRSWCSSSAANDQRAITIECASDKNEPYTMNSAVYNMLIKLCVDICKRNGKTKLLWFADKTKTLNYSPKSNEMVLTVHRWFANKSCPGDWLYNRLSDVATQVTNQLAGTASSSSTGSSSTTATTSSSTGNTQYSGKGIGTAIAQATMYIRSGKGTSYSALGTISKGTAVEVLEVCSNGWYKIVWPGATLGYAYTSNSTGTYYKYAANKASSASSSDKNPAESYDKSIKGYYRTTANLNMRSGAGTKCSILLTIPKGKKVKNYGYYTEINGVKWYYITYSKKKGFVSSEYLTKA